MAALPILKYFNLFNDLLRGLFPCVIVRMMNEFTFQGTKEAFDAGVVPAIPCATHAGNGTVLVKDTLVARGGILTPR